MDGKLVVVIVSTLCVLTAEAINQRQCVQREILKELYRSLFEVLNKSAICSSERGQENIELLELGTPLVYSDFNPGKPSKFSQPGDLPSFVLENGLSLIDGIYPTGSARFRLLSNVSDNMKDYRFDSMSSTYDYILTHMLLAPQNFSDADVLRAKYYLQELVPNPERVLRNDTQLPRFLLYDFYRLNYITEKAIKDDEIANKRIQLPQHSYEVWGQKKLSSYESDAEAAYNKWQAFGYKSEVEKQLQYFDIDTHEDKLMSTRALFKSMGRPSERDAHKTIYPYKLEPSNWHDYLKVKLPESADELRYKKSMLLTQQALLNATNVELSNTTSADVDERLLNLKKSKEKLLRFVQNGVDKLIQMEVECFTRVNLTICGEIVQGHTAFRAILEEISEHFEQAEYLESILKGRENTLPVLREKLDKVSSELKILDAEISSADQDEIAQDIDASTSTDFDQSSCPALGQIKFAFDSQAVAAEIHCSGMNDIQCFDSRVPVNATTKSLWNVHSCTVDSELCSFNCLNNFTKLMNSVPVKVTASLQKVKVMRSWFNEAIFKETDHYIMKRGSGVVSPGPLSPSHYFQRVAHSRQYLLPHYVSAIIVANNIKLFYPGLGSWNFTENDNELNNVIQILMKYAYAHLLTGGVGPFSFELHTGLNHNFQLKRQNGGLLITVPGGQVIGYILKTVPKFPENQNEPAKSPLQCDEQPLESSSRKRRSVSEDFMPNHPVDMKTLARSLFSKGLRDRERNDISDGSSMVLSQDIEDFIHKSDMKLEELSHFIKTMKKTKGPGDLPLHALGAVNRTMESLS